MEIISTSQQTKKTEIYRTTSCSVLLCNLPHNPLYHLPSSWSMQVLDVKLDAEFFELPSSQQFSENVCKL